MTILTFPTLSRTPSNLSYRLRGNSQTHRSPLDGTTQTLEMPGSVWEFTVTWESLQEPDWRTLGAFLSRLRGRAGRFTFSPAIFAPRRGVATSPGTPIFYSAPATGEVFVTEGWTPLTGVGTEVGDWMSYVDASGRQRLHLSVEAFLVQGTGRCSHRFTPTMRSPPILGQPLEVVAPVGVFMLTDDGAPEMAVRPPRLGAVTLTMQEALV